MNVCTHTLSVTAQDGNTALILAAWYGETDVVVTLVRGGAHLDLQNEVCWVINEATQESQPALHTCRQRFLWVWSFLISTHIPEHNTTCIPETGLMSLWLAHILYIRIIHVLHTVCTMHSMSRLSPSTVVLCWEWFSYTVYRGTANILTLSLLSSLSSFSDKCSRYPQNSVLCWLIHTCTYIPFIHLCVVPTVCHSLLACSM